ncbi:MAG: hypothetical protein LBI77_01555 [Puniceicoccales bacterium]|nr:hypothetical protein [Puniceicoccales bacterium]
MSLLFRLLLWPFKIIRFTWRLCSKLIHFLAILAIWVSLFAVIFFLSFNRWFPSVARHYVFKKSGFNLHIDQSQCSLWRGLIDLNGIEIKNPAKKFSQNDCLNINRLMIKMNLLSLLNPEVVVDEVTIDMDRIVCDQNNSGDIGILKLCKALTASEDETLKSREKKLEPLRKSNQKNGHTKYLSNVTSNGEESDKKLLKLASVKEGSQFMVKKMNLRIGRFELYNITGKDEHKTINVDVNWNFTDVRSKNEVINRVMSGLKGYGISVIVEKFLNSIFDLPGVKIFKHSVRKVSNFCQEIFKKITSSIVDSMAKAGSIKNSLMNIPQNEESMDISTLQSKLPQLNLQGIESNIQDGEGE